MHRFPTSEQILDLARECISLSSRERTELQWLKARYENIQNKYHFKTRHETDLFLYEKMYGRNPDKSSELLKIRYWRTGKHTPLNREQCLLFGKALELSPEDMRFLIQGYYDRSLEIFNSPSFLPPPRKNAAA